MRNDETNGDGLEAGEARDRDGVRTGADWSPFHELRGPIEALYALAWVRWHPQNPETADLPVARDVRDALQDLRAIVKEARALWSWLERYAPHTPPPPTPVAGARPARMTVPFECACGAREVAA